MISLKQILLPVLPAVLLCCCARESSELHIVTTGDVHGAFFPDSYTGGKTRPSLMAVNRYADSLRQVVGEDNVLLLDAGDFLQGDNAAYYFNYVSEDAHLYPRLASYMGYDAVTLGNHDIETGHPVYDRVFSELEARGIPCLAGNAYKPDGKLYFPECVLLRKGGRKVLVLGFNNAAIHTWLSEDLWSGMHFESLVPLVQRRIEALNRKYRPEVVIAVIHSGTGEGDGSVLESQGLDIFKTLTGADLLVCGHDHKPFADTLGNSCIVNSGSRCASVGHSVISFGKKAVPGGNKVRSETVRIDKNAVDTAMKAAFAPDFEAVKAFTLKPVGILSRTIRTRDAYVGVSDYMKLIHSVQLSVPGVQISFSAPLTFNGTIDAGQLVFNDMFTIYPFENRLHVVRMKGSEIISYLEASYDRWIVTGSDHLLRIVGRGDPRIGQERWSFEERSYNFDSAAGLCYTVDISRPRGERISVSSLSDGSAFDPSAWYNVAMTSYRASGGGGLLAEGAGIGLPDMDSRTVSRYGEIRDMIYDYIVASGGADLDSIDADGRLGEWHFIPRETAARLLEQDMKLLFP